jgi:putative transposase
MRNPRTDPAVGRRLAMARYARMHSKAQAARHFGCCWATIQAAVRRVAEYERTGDIGVLQNAPRGKTGRTRSEVEDLVISIYRESFEPERPQGRRYSAAKVARLLKKRYNIQLSRKTVWLILCRRGEWEAIYGQKRAIQRFEREQPNELWQIDLIEKEPTAIGDVFGVPIIDDHSRYLVGLRFFLDKGEHTTLLTTYQAMVECGTPAEMLCDRGRQFVDPGGAGTTRFEDMLQALGIRLRIAFRAQTKGKEERINQFIERDFLDEVRWQVPSLTDLNRRADTWRADYNHTHVNESIRCTPAQRYQPGLQVDPQFLRRIFAAEQRRKVTHEATIRYRNRRFQVPDQYIGWSVWVANFFDHSIEIRTGSKIIATYQL